MFAVKGEEGKIRARPLDELGPPLPHARVSATPTPHRRPTAARSTPHSTPASPKASSNPPTPRSDSSPASRSASTATNHSSPSPCSPSAHTHPVSQAEHDPRNQQESGITAPRRRLRGESHGGSDMLGGWRSTCCRTVRRSLDEVLAGAPWRCDAGFGDVWLTDLLAASGKAREAFPVLDDVHGDRGDSSPHHGGAACAQRGVPVVMYVGLLAATSRTLASGYFCSDRGRLDCHPTWPIMWHLG